MPKNKKAYNLARLLTYALGRRPGEFGLVPDDDGFFKIKDVLKAVCEEDGFGYVRLAHINEILLTIPDPGLEIMGNRIRAGGRPPPAPPAETADLPKLLYTCVRRRAYPHVLERGITPSSHSRVVLSDSKEMAERIGRRSDPSPVALTVQVASAREHGISFHSAGSNLYLAAEIPPPCFRGPALPKEAERKHAESPAPETKRSATPGSYTIDLARAAEAAGVPDDKRGTKGPARGRRKANKPKRERPPWRK